MLTTKKYYDFSDVLIRPKLSNINTRTEVKLTSDFGERDELFIEWNPVPIMAANMDTVCGTEMAFTLAKHNWIAVLHKYVSITEIQKLFDDIDAHNLVNENKIDYRNIFISRGTTDKDMEKLQERLDVEKRIKSVCIDVANGQRETVVSYIKKLKNSSCKNKILMVGNIGSSDMIKPYIQAGVDIIKAGIGPGSACLTRVKTGVGIPQISLIDELRTELNRLTKTNQNQPLLVSDGGCKTPGDVAKAFAAGSDFVMIGGMLAGTKETPGIIEDIDGRKYKKFSGMAASESQHNGIPTHGTEEGKTVMIPYKGKVSHIIQDIEGGLRSTCTYVNAHTISELVNAELIITNVQENKIFSK